MIIRMKPKKKIFKYTIKKKTLNKTKLIFGNFGIETMNNGLIHHNNIENLRRRLTKQFKRLHSATKTKLFFKLSLWKGYTKKPMLSRMGKGAGSIYKWNCFLKKGIVFLEILTIQSPIVIFSIYKKAIRSFPLKLRLLHKKE